MGLFCEKTLFQRMSSSWEKSLLEDKSWECHADNKKTRNESEVDEKIVCFQRTSLFKEDDKTRLDMNPPEKQVESTASLPFYRSLNVNIEFMLSWILNEPDNACLQRS